MILERLSTDDDFRARFVELLRASADALREHGKSGEKLACQLFDAASQLCSHTRLNPDGTCRYCDAPIAGVQA